MIDDYTGLVEKLRKDMRKTMKPSRYQHSERTADTARKLCEMYDLDTDKGFLAGLAHDICKDYDDKAIMALVKKDGLPIDSIEKKHNNTLHGRAAAVLLETKYFIDDEEILEAIRYHTFGHAGMGDLAKVLYIADKIEPGRTHIPAGYMDMHEDDTLDEFIISVLQEGMTYLMNQGYNISMQTEQFLYSLVHGDESAGDGNKAGDDSAGDGSGAGDGGKNGVDNGESNS